MHSVVNQHYVLNCASYLCKSILVQDFLFKCRERSPQVSHVRTSLLIIPVTKFSLNRLDVLENSFYNGYMVSHSEGKGENFMNAIRYLTGDQMCLYVVYSSSESSALQYPMLLKTTSSFLCKSPSVLANVSLVPFMYPFET